MSEDRDFTLDDFVTQLRQMRRLGPVSRVMSSIPGMGEMLTKLSMDAADVERQMDQMKAMYESMTRRERDDVSSISPERRVRIAKGAGVQAKDVEQFVRQFRLARDMMRAM